VRWSGAIGRLARWLRPKQDLAGFKLICRVQKEIHNFGGDAAAVAIFGQSSGAGCVELLTRSPLSKGARGRGAIGGRGGSEGSSVAPLGLFRGAISQSGGLGAKPLQSALQTTAELARRLNCSARTLRQRAIASMLAA
jgi:carboxylesterase type B